MSRGITHVLFDLDGTLADTAADLGAALNRVLAEEGMPPVPLEKIRPAVSRGGAGMIQLGFGIGADHPQFSAHRDRFLAHYRRNVADRTVLFPGIAELLDALEGGAYGWGIVTNKPAAMTVPLLRELRLLERAECIVSGDTAEFPKPHPAPLLHACELLQCDPAQAVYIGDAQRDIEAARRAGMPVVIAAYGYIDGDEPPEGWGADAIINQPVDLLHWLAQSGN